MVKHIRKVSFALPAVALLVAATAPAPDAGAAAVAALQEAYPSLAVDRWLVAEPRPASASLPAPGSDRLEELASDPRFLPDRDRVVRSAYWHLVRDDSTRTFRADRLGGAFPSSGGAVLAHAYVRLPEDRTLRVAWTRPSCGAGSLWLNGQRLSAPDSAGASSADAGSAGGAGGAAGGDTVEARFAAGWNALLLAAEPADCPPVFGAALLPGGGTRAGEAAARGPGVHADLEQVRVQASRPPGAHRTWPRPWATASAPSPAGGPEWRSGDDRLRGTVAVDVVPWGRAPGDTLAVVDVAGREEGEAAAAGADTAGADEGPGRPGADAPPDSARPRPGGPPPLPPPLPDRLRVRLEVAGEAAERTLADPAPTRGETVESQALPFEELREVALGDDGVQIELRWEDEEREIEGTLAAGDLLTWLHGPIGLRGWSAATGGGAVELPEGPGAPLVGRWRVPEALAGLDLVLDVDGAPGRYRLDDASLEPRDGSLRLCGPCQEGRQLRLSVETTGAWTAWPQARIVQGGYPAAAGAEGAPPADVWLRALEGGEDNRAYVEMSRRHAGDAAGSPP